ncbi:MAG TPA: hypothetical protein VFE50_22275, partial [Cyclobacteriaceae bacterium]|nr:hypothetical protein [Cyclobacteriaceae bacterium]
ASMIEQIFVVFGIFVEVGGVLVILGLMLTMMLPVFNEIFKTTGKLAVWSSISVFVVMFVVGHFTSGFSEKKPMQTYLSYYLNADEGKGYWRTRRGSEETTLLSYESPGLKITSDTTVSNIRVLRLHCSARKEAISMRVAFGGGVNDISVIGPAGGRGNDNRTRGNFFTVDYAGLDSAGFDLVVETEPGNSFDVTLTDRSLGLPLDGGKGYRSDEIPGTGPMANTIQVTKKFQVGN